MGYRLREVQLPILSKGRPALRVLHFSDLHLTLRRKREFADIRSFESLKPDLVIATGDFLGDENAIDTVLLALDPILGIPGFFVFGSNDYFGPRFKNPISYLKKDDGRRKLGKIIETAKLNRGLSARGWINLNETKVLRKINGVSIEARGTDDAHLELDDYQKVAGQKNPSTDLSIGVTHAPYNRVLESMTSDGLDLIFAGHTHGGQIRVPWFGGSRSLTTNSDLPNWRSRGLTKLNGSTYLSVSAGMGYGKFAPIRVLCPPEVTIMTIRGNSNE